MYNSGSFIFRPTPFEPTPDPLFDKYGPLRKEEVRMVRGSDGKEYKILRRKNYYQCNCPAFVFQYDTLWELRTCKHLIRLRGKAAEDERIHDFNLHIYGPLGRKLEEKKPLTKKEEDSLGPLLDGEKQVVKGTQDWVVERKRDYYQCSCPAFKYQKGSRKGGAHWEARTCKHIKQIRGERAEKVRCAAAQVRKAGEREVKLKAKKQTMVKKVKEEEEEERVKRESEEDVYITVGGKLKKVTKAEAEALGRRKGKKAYTPPVKVKVKVKEELFEDDYPETPRTPVRTRKRSSTASAGSSPRSVSTPIKRSRGLEAASPSQGFRLNTPKKASGMKNSRKLSATTKRSAKSGKSVATASTKASSARSVATKKSSKSRRSRK